MAAITFYFLPDTVAGSSGYGSLQDGGTPPSTADTASGWIAPGTLGTKYSKYFRGITRAANTFVASPVQPDGSLDNANGDCLRSQNTYNGSFPGGNWTFSFGIRSNSNLNNDNATLRFRVFRSVNQDGSSATEITASTQESAQFHDNSTSAQTITITWNAPSFSLSNEYLFIEVALKALVSGPDGETWLLQKGAAYTIVTPGFSPPVDLGTLAPGFGGGGGPPDRRTPWFRYFLSPDSGYPSIPAAQGGSQKKWYFLDVKAPGANHGALQEQMPPAAGDASTAWNEGTYPALYYSKQNFGATNNIFANLPIQPDGVIDNSIGNCYRTQKAYTGNFADNPSDPNNPLRWTISFSLRSNVNAGSQNGLDLSVAWRIFRSTDKIGAGAVELTSGAVARIFCSADGAAHPGNANFNLGAFALNNEYLFFQIGVQILVKHTNLIWLTQIGSSFGITSTLFTETVAAPAPVLPSAPGFTIGPDPRSPYWKNLIIPEAPLIVPPPTNYANPGTLQIYAPGFIGGPLQGTPWQSGPTGIGQVQPPPPGLAPVPPSSFIPTPGFTTGPQQIGVPWAILGQPQRPDIPQIPRTTNPQPPSIAALSLVTRDPVDDPRLRRFMDQVTGILNSLIMQGVLTRKDVFNWQLNVAPVITTGNGPPTSGHDATQGYQPGSLYLDVQNQVFYANLTNAQGHAKWQSLPGTVTGG